MAPKRPMVMTCGALTALLLFVASTAAAFGADGPLPEGPGVNLVYAHCRTCHSLSYVTEAKGLLPAQWESLIASMEDYGLEISAADKRKVLAYLKTYLGPNPPPQTQSTTQTEPIDGSVVYQHSCAVCHGASGLGQPGYFPPLANNPDLFRTRVFPILVVLNGISGPIKVNGQTYNGSMPAFAYLSDAKIAAVVNHVRSAWGNAQIASMKPVTAALVAQQRKLDLSPTEVHARRAQVVDTDD